MKVSLNTVKHLINFDLPPVDELVRRINEQLGSVDEVIDLGAKYAGAVIVRVMSAEKHPNADRLSICKIDDGRAVAGLDRDEDGYVQVVCGAPNVHADMWAVWLPPRTTVPSSFDDTEPFVLDTRELRGVMSNGMLAAGDELAINSDHEGIIELQEYDLPPELDGRGLATGQDFAEVFGLDDTIIDIENKMFTHRPDCFGQIGVAREIAGILGQTFASPQWYLNIPSFVEGEGLEFELYNDAPDKVSRLMAVAMKNVTVGKSPMWLQTTLLRWGSKSINNVVDATNYIMLLTAQPTHAYDYDKLRGHKLGARMAHDGEKITLLNGKTYELTADDIVMADGKGAVGVAGIMGGGESEVSATTKNIVLEVATFDMYTVRKSSMRYGLFTDALTRFNKGQSPLQNDRIIWALMQDMTEHAGARIGSPVYDIANDAIKPRIESQDGAVPMTIDPKFIRDRLGADISKYDMVQALGNVEFPLCEDCGWNPEDEEDNRSELHVNVPFWRTDIELHEDVVEEIGRLYGFDKLPRELPMRTSAPAPKNALREIKQQIRESLARAGANEVLSYSFIHENVMKRAEQDASQAFKLSNALSPDLQYYRLSVLPSLLDKVHMNIKLGYDEFVLFEIGKAHNKQHHANDDNGLPRELEMIDAVYASKKSSKGAAYYHIRGLVENLAKSLSITFVYKPITESVDYPLTAPFDHARSALIETTEGVFIGIIGELKSSVRKNFKLPDQTAATSLDIEGLQKACVTASKTYQPLSRFPSISQDISLKTTSDTLYTELYSVVQSAIAEKAGEIKAVVEPISIYQADDDTDYRTTTFHITFTDYERTLTDNDIKPIMDHIAGSAITTVSAERI